MIDGLTIDAARLSREIADLASMSEATPPAVTRIVYTQADQHARAWVKNLMTEAGLEVREDALGNTFARWPGLDPFLAPVGTGSHIDAIPNAGAYDGTVGVLGGLEAIRALRRAGYQPRRSIELLLLTSEEPTRFGIGCLGSRALCGALSAGQIAALRDAEGHTVDEARAAAGFSGDIHGVALDKGYYESWVELHIEQGPILEAEGLDVGVVTAIAAPSQLVVTFEGEGGHAGAVLMPDRHDALCAAAEIILAVEQAATSTGSPDTVGTVGKVEVFPGAVNSVPSRVVLHVDVRDIRLGSRDAAMNAIRAAVDCLQASRGVAGTVSVINADPPAECSPAIIEAVEAAAVESRASHRQMISRAYHDSLFMARIAPIGMIFIPCRGGVSHRPDEYASPDHIELGTAVLARTLARLAQA